jgi:hypothetical protein
MSISATECSVTGKVAFYVKNESFDLQQMLWSVKINFQGDED